jgi:hypothetical protein
LRRDRRRIRSVDIIDLNAELWQETLKEPEGVAVDVTGRENSVAALQQRLPARRYVFPAP